MAAKQTQIAFLFQKLANGAATTEEVEQYYQLVKEPALEAEIKALMLAELSDSILVEETNRKRIDEVYHSVQQVILVDRRKKMPILAKLWPQLTAVAAAVAIIISGVYFFKYNNKKISEVQKEAYLNDIAPGKQGATLTLANGHKILINDASAGSIASQSGVKISKTADGRIIYEVTSAKSGTLEYNTLSTTRGEQTQVRLPDGSLVFLNAASSLKYPTSFSKQGSRRVSLTGEGYFEVAKDKTHPFIVTTDKQEIEVLGTHFNVNAYENEPIVATTLIEGSVKVIAGKNQQLLKPGFQAINDGSSIKIGVADIDNIIDWKEGDFYFESADFRSVMRKIGRWYDVEIVYDHSVPENMTSSGVISRNNNLSAVLKLIEKSGQVHFKIEGKKVLISK